MFGSLLNWLLGRRGGTAGDHAEWSCHRLNADQQRFVAVVDSVP